MEARSEHSCYTSLNLQPVSQLHFVNWNTLIDKTMVVINSYLVTEHAGLELIETTEAFFPSF